MQTRSDVCTRGVRVCASSSYAADRSVSSLQQYFFTYRIQIENTLSRPVQLLSRHWIITNGLGECSQVNGPGVVGEQPVLQPGGRFEYVSACPLRTPAGTMRGTYRFRALPSSAADAGSAGARGGVSGDGGFNDGQLFEVEVGEFALDVAGRAVTLGTPARPQQNGGA